MKQDRLFSAPASVPAAPILSFARDLVRQGFDADWYRGVYAGQILRHARPGESAFEFYLRAGARMGHDPNPGFSELLYRRASPDICDAIREGSIAFGYLHWVTGGAYETTRHHASDAEIALVRRIGATLDREHIAAAYPLAGKLHVSEADFYLARVADLRLSPSALFSEPAYLEDNPDIAELVLAGSQRSGYAHYLLAGMREGRRARSEAEYRGDQVRASVEAVAAECRAILEHALPGVTQPDGLRILEAIDYFTAPPDIRLDIGSDMPDLLVLVPNFLPEILFGGYQAFFAFLRALKARMGLRLHLLVVNPGAADRLGGDVLRMQAQHPEVAVLFESIAAVAPDRQVTIGARTRVISYCAELHYMAAAIAARCDRRPVFFVQEYEPDFHPSSDMRSFIAGAFRLPHRAIYNSAKLLEFMENDSGLVGAGHPERHAVLENPIRAATPAQLDAIRARAPQERRRLIFYARPEAHAARNHFATAVLALREVIRRGAFDGAPWEFVGIGALTGIEPVELGGRHRLELRPRMPKAEYEDFLLTGDIGVSLISTPHPGIIHFQMAAYGLVTLTNLAPHRDAGWLKAQNGNLIGAELSVDGLVRGLEACVAACEDAATRRRHAAAALCPTAEACMAPALDFMQTLFAEA